MNSHVERLPIDSRPQIPEREPIRPKSSLQHGSRVQDSTFWRLFKRLSGKVALYVTVLVICLYSFIPIYWMIISSLRTSERLFLDTSLVFWPPDLTSYISLFRQTNYVVNFLNSALMAVATITVSLMLSAFVAYGATRLRFRGKTMLVASMLFAYMFPPLMLAIPMAATFRTIGLTTHCGGC